MKGTIIHEHPINKHPLFTDLGSRNFSVCSRSQALVRDRDLTNLDYSWIKEYLTNKTPGGRKATFRLYHARSKGETRVFPLPNSTLDLTFHQSVVALITERLPKKA